NHPRGVCVDGVCECVKGYSGDECEIPTYQCYGKNVSEACNAPYGKCNGPDLCECQDGFTGTECEIISCYSKIGTAACSYPNGTCESPNNCTCEPGYSGTECEKI